jgi:hypothetical protein
VNTTLTPDERAILAEGFAALSQEHERLFTA